MSCYHRRGSSPSPSTCTFSLVVVIAVAYILSRFPKLTPSLHVKYLRCRFRRNQPSMPPSTTVATIISNCTKYAYRVTLFRRRHHLPSMSVAFHLDLSFKTQDICSYYIPGLGYPGSCELDQ